eukprot:6545468-Prymnesium_polylepis.1
MGSRGRSSSMRFAAGSSTGATSAARWGDDRKPFARPVTAGSRRAGGPAREVYLQGLLRLARSEGAFRACFP